jgi:hypothetical protein
VTVVNNQREPIVEMKINSEGVFMHVKGLKIRKRDRSHG